MGMAMSPDEEWDRRNADQKLQMLYDWVKRLSDRVQQHEKALSLVSDRLEALEKKTGLTR